MPPFFLEGERLILVDVSAMGYRKFFAVKNADPSEVARGVVKEISRFAKGEFYGFRPDYVVCCCDSPDGGEARRAIYPGYKAKRPPRPEGLDETMRERLPRLLEEAGFPPVMVPGCEADDLIATYAALAHMDGACTLILTHDKDMMQCLTADGLVAMCDLAAWPNRIVYEGEPPGWLTVKPELLSSVESVWGVTAAQVPHVQALAGDASDGYPGAPGIGEKSAKALIALAGSVFDVLDAAVAQPALLAEAGVKGKKLAALARLDTYEAVTNFLALATLRTDCEVPMPTPINRERDVVRNASHSLAASAL